MTLFTLLDIASDVSDGLVEGFGHVLDILRVQSTDVDTAVLEQEDLVVLVQMLDLGRGQSGEAEESDLLRDMLPVARGSERLEMAAKSGSHLTNPRRHGLDALVPLLTKLRVGQDHVNDTGTMARWIRPVGTDYQRHLRLNTVETRWILDHDRQISDTFI